MLIYKHNKKERMKMTKQRTWNISWYVGHDKEDDESCPLERSTRNIKEVLETVNCDNYIDRETEKQDVLDQIKTKHNLHDDKFIFISEVK
jgi:hypothetical protein